MSKALRMADRTSATTKLQNAVIPTTMRFENQAKEKSLDFFQYRMFTMMKIPTRNRSWISVFNDYTSPRCCFDSLAISHRCRKQSIAIGRGKKRGPKALWGGIRISENSPLVY